MYLLACTSDSVSSTLCILLSPHHPHSPTSSAHILLPYHRPHSATPSRCLALVASPGGPRWPAACACSACGLNSAALRRRVAPQPAGRRSPPPPPPPPSRSPRHSMEPRTRPCLPSPRGRPLRSTRCSPGCTRARERRQRRVAAPRWDPSRCARARQWAGRRQCWQALSWTRWRCRWRCWDEWGGGKGGGRAGSRRGVTGGRG